MVHEELLPLGLSVGVKDEVSEESDFTVCSDAKKPANE